MDKEIVNLLNLISRGTKRKLYNSRYHQERAIQELHLKEGKISRLHVNKSLAKELAPPGKEKLTLQTIHNYNQGNTVPNGEVLLQVLKTSSLEVSLMYIIEDLSEVLQLLFSNLVDMDRKNWGRTGIDDWGELKSYSFEEKKEYSVARFLTTEVLIKVAKNDRSAFRETVESHEEGEEPELFDLLRDDDSRKFYKDIFENQPEEKEPGFEDSIADVTAERAHEILTERMPDELKDDDRFI